LPPGNLARRPLYPGQIIHPRLSESIGWLSAGRANSYITMALCMTKTAR